MPCKGVQELSGLHVPQLDCSITTTTGKGLPIGTDGDTNNGAFMSREGAQEISRLHVPQTGWLLPHLNQYRGICLVYLSLAERMMS